MVVAAVVLGSASAASATWSIIAVDPETGLIGGAMASCVPASVLGDPDQALVPLVLVPGQAVAVTQGTIDPTAPQRLRQLLDDGADPTQAVAVMLEDDDQPTVRQYSVIDSDGAVRTFGGDDLESPAVIRTGDGVTAQGVLLRDEAVVDAALSAYQVAISEGRSFDRALADALLAGSQAGGDQRCPEDQTALFAHLAVAEPDDAPDRPSLVLTVSVDEGDGQNPVVLLDQALDEGRIGWIDAGLREPSGIPRLAVGLVATAMAIAAVLVLRRGMGNRAARR